VRVSDAKRYIEELHRKQENPYLWPDFLTGLPDKTAIIKKLEEVFPKVGKVSIAYVRIANVHPYLIKYGPDKHAAIIQWAAAILKTTCEECKKCFVGTLGTHDFIMVCDTEDMPKHLREAGRIFRKKAESYYTKEDLRNKIVLSINRTDGRVNIGLMRLVSVIVNRRLPVEKQHLIQNMGRVCEALEGTDEDITVMTEDMICI
jgi:GGDEF domain-containing protein